MHFTSFFYGYITSIVLFAHIYMGFSIAMQN